MDFGGFGKTRFAVVIIFLINFATFCIFYWLFVITLKWCKIQCKVWRWIRVRCKTYKLLRTKWWGWSTRDKCPIKLWCLFKIFFVVGSFVAFKHMNTWSHCFPNLFDLKFLVLILSRCCIGDFSRFIPQKLNWHKPPNNWCKFVSTQWHE